MMERGVKYLNNLIEQDHRFIKKITKPMMGFKAFHSAQATIDGIQTAHMIRKWQLSEENIPAYKQFLALAGKFCPQINAGCSLRNICDTILCKVIT
jgi:hypothetical protein